VASSQAFDMTYSFYGNLLGRVLPKESRLTSGGVFRQTALLFGLIASIIMTLSLVLITFATT